MTQASYIAYHGKVAFQHPVTSDDTASYIAYHGKVAFQHPVTSDDTGKLHRVTW